MNSGWAYLSVGHPCTSIAVTTCLLHAVYTDVIGGRIRSEYVLLSPNTGLPIHASPIGLVPKNHQHIRRMIVHLSSPVHHEARV